MPLNALDKNVAIHQTLGDTPNVNMTADELKEKFDEGAEIIKKYLNDEVAPKAMNRGGDSMTGTLNMNGNTLTGLPTPENPQNAVPLNYLQAELAKKSNKDHKHSADDLNDADSFYMLTDPHAAPSGMDFNSYTTPGMHNVTHGVLTSAAHAPPKASGGKLIVENISGACRQTYSCLTGGDFRRYKTSSGAWTDWVDLRASNGLTMEGALDMGGYTLTGLPTPVYGQNAVPLNYLQANYMPLSGGTVSGDITRAAASGEANFKAISSGANVWLSAAPVNHGVWSQTMGEWLIYSNGISIRAGNKPFVLSSSHYGDSLPAAGTKGRIFFKKV